MATRAHPRPPGLHAALAFARALALALACASAAVAEAPPPRPPDDELLRRLAAQGDSLARQQRALDTLAQQVDSLRRQLAELCAQVPGPETRQALEERMRRVEEAALRAPELPPDAVSAGDFPGSIRIPGTDAAVKFGGNIRTVLAFTLDPLGTTDRFLTYSIPVPRATTGEAKRTTFSANTSRLNFEMRTPAGATQMRTFLEGDFYGRTGTGDTRTSFRLRHAYAQYRRLLVGQTWSTFSDPGADYEALDLEGMNGENVIRQAQARMKWQLGEAWSLAAAAETPDVSLTGGRAVNLVPDVVARAVRTLRDSGHLQGALVARQIRGEPDSLPGTVKRVFGWGGSVSGVVPVTAAGRADRLIFQANFGKGNARYINDLNSLGGEDAVFHPATGELNALPTVGWYVDVEHQWVGWRQARAMRLRSSFVWGFVNVKNLDYEPPDAYHRTGRYSANLVFSPTPRIDTGIEFIHGTRENKSGERSSANQIQLVTIYRM